MTTRRTRVAALTEAEVRALPVTVDLQTAGLAFALGRTGVYDAFKRGDFPCRTVRIGRAHRVPKAELLRVLGITDEPVRSDAG